MRPKPLARHPGFTLVELLMVIVIIGVLASLLIVAVRPALTTANNAVVKTEINQLDLAINNYRDTYGALPPTMVTWGDTTSSAFSGDSSIFYDEIQKQKRFVRHVRKAFPRYRGTWVEAGTAIYGNTAFTSGGSYTFSNCDLKSMDAAEALVFWLGGMPKIWKANDGEYEVELTGFSKDPSNPFLPEYEPAGGGTAGVDFQPERTVPLFEFDARRLVDTDKDGWPEYIPDTGGSASETPPYVYFDATAYGLLPFYPSVKHPSMASAVSSWGVARPYLSRYTPDTGDAELMPLSGNFTTPDAFQIICGGADNKYSDMVVANTYGDTNGGTLDESEIKDIVNLLPVYPEGLLYHRTSTFPTSGSIDALQFDNLTNFTESKLENDFNSGN